ncbi:MAG: DMT family transporter [Ferrovum sp.]|nr:DMT family transporter [Ferrovum sp.]
MSTPHAHPRWKGFLAAAIVVACWSGFNIVSRMGGKSTLTPYDLTALRFGVSGILMLPVYFLSRNPLPLRQVITIACCGGLFYALMIYTGFSLAPAAHAGVLVNGGIPLASAMIAWLWLKDRPHGVTLLALTLTALGLVVIGFSSFTSGAGAASRQPLSWVGDLCFVGAALSWAFYGLLVRVWNIRPLDAVSGITVGAAVLYLPLYVLFLPKGLAGVSTSALLLQAGYQGIVAALIAAFGFAYATLSLGSGIASMMLAIVPGITALLAVPFLNEALTPVTLGGVALVSVGAALGAWVKKAAPTPTLKPHSPD